MPSHSRVPMPRPAAPLLAAPIPRIARPAPAARPTPTAIPRPPRSTRSITSRPTRMVTPRIRRTRPPARRRRARTAAARRISLRIRSSSLLYPIQRRLARAAFTFCYGRGLLVCECVTAEHLHIVAAFKGSRLRHVLLAHAALHLVDRFVPVFLHPLLHALQQHTDVIDTLFEKR